MHPANLTDRCFAGVLRIEVPPEAIPALQAALAELEAEGLRVVAEGGAATADTELRAMELQLVGQDHPGIVRDVSKVLLQHGVNIEELTTDNVSAPMSGDSSSAPGPAFAFPPTPIRMGSGGTSRRSRTISWWT